MNRMLLTLSILTFCGCSQLHKQKDTIRLENIIASYKGGNILANELDSIANNQVYNLKLSILESYLDQKVLALEAKKQNMNLSDLLKKKVSFISSTYKKTSVNYSEKEILKYRDYVDSLKHVYDAEIRFKPNGFNEIDVSNLYYLHLAGSNNNIVYVVSNFNCSSCKKASKKLFNIIKKYSNQVEFRYLSFSEYYGLLDKGIIAANNQNEALIFYQKFSESLGSVSDTSFLYDYISSSQIDVSTFMEDIEDKTDLLKALKTKEQIISKGIYSTPTFIVNNKVLDGNYAINYLENVINDEFNLYK